jgi:hypothetical protein
MGFCSVLEGLTGSRKVCGKLGEQGNVVSEEWMVVLECNVVEVQGNIRNFI